MARCLCFNLRPSPTPNAVPTQPRPPPPAARAPPPWRPLPPHPQSSKPRARPSSSILPRVKSSRATRAFYNGFPLSPPTSRPFSKPPLNTSAKHSTSPKPRFTPCPANGCTTCAASPVARHFTQHRPRHHDRRHWHGREERQGDVVGGEELAELVECTESGGSRG